VTSYRPVDIAGEVDSPVGPSRLVAISTSSTGQSKPSNVWVLDVSDDATTEWIGAVSLTASAQEGYIVRTFIKSGVLYSASHKKGLQIADLTAVKNNFRHFEDDPQGHFEMRRDFHTNGRGYGSQDVVDVAISGPASGPARLEDVEAGLVRTAAAPEPRLLVTLAGDSGLTVVDPGLRNVLSNEPVSVKDVGGATLATIHGGQALAMGTLSASGGGTQDVTVLAMERAGFSGGFAHMLAEDNDVDLHVACDLVARTILAPVEVPVGVVTAMLGGPFFLWMLVRKG
jgi:hypothetical protein